MLIAGINGALEGAYKIVHKESHETYSRDDKLQQQP